MDRSGEGEGGSGVGGGGGVCVCVDVDLLNRACLFLCRTRMKMFV